MGRPPRLLLPLLLVPALAARTAAQPDTPRKPDTVTYHGVRVTEDYRWLEDTGAAAVRRWVDDQNRHSRTALRRLPNLPALRKRVKALYDGAPPSFEKVQSANGVLCAECDRSLVVLKSEADAQPARTLVDIDDSPAGKRAAIDFYYLSGDGRFAAVSLSADGLEEGTIHVYETATGKKLPDQVPQVYAAPGGDLAWKPDGSGFYYTRYPDATPGGKSGRERYARQEVWSHRLGDKVGDDRYVCGRDFPIYTRFFLLTSDSGKHMVLGAYTGYGSDETAWYWLDPAGKLEPLAKPEDRVLNVNFGPDDTLLLESWKDAPRGRLLRLSLAEPTLARARELVPQGDAVLHSWQATDRFVYVVDRRDGSERLRVFDPAGRDQPAVALPPHTAVAELIHLKGDVVLYRLTSYLEPPAWYRYDPATRKAERVALSEKWAGDFRDIEVAREWAASKDGTRVPLTVLRRKDYKPDGDRPVILAGYGSAREHIRPEFLADRRVWFDHGGVWAIAHPRGEAELGDDWHRSARGAAKQVTADDFIACAERLIKEKYTRPGRLAFCGGSDGGLLMGMALTQRPDLCAASVVDCGVLDVLRLDKDYYGPHCLSEYGRLDTPRNVEIALGYSPLHRIKVGTAYPAVWFRVGANDRRVDPVHTWKMAAQMQASGTKKPVLLTTVAGEGHDFTTSSAEEFAFLFDHLGVKYQAK